MQGGLEMQVDLVGVGAWQKNFGAFFEFAAGSDHEGGLSKRVGLAQIGDVA